jgi:cephalosporin-C deacetylase-like acetyl esterase
MNFNLSRRSLGGLVVACAVLVSLPLCPATAAQPATDYTLTVSTARPDAIYKQGEKVVYTVKLLLDHQPVKSAEVRWTISKDGVPPIRTGHLKLSDGSGELTGELNEPGFLQCSVDFQTPAKSGLRAVAGAAIDPLAIKPSLPVPADFDSFWSAQKEKLAQVPVNPRLTPIESQPGVELFDLQADCVGAPVSGYFARPAGAKTKSLPIILTVQGAGVRNSNRAGTVGWAKDGFLALDINAHGIPNGKPDEFYTGLADGDLKDYRTRGRESRETVYFLGMFLREVRALDFLTAQPEWNGRTVIVHGGSQGGAQSIVAAGLDSRVTFFAAMVPAMCDHSGGVVGRINGWPKLVPDDPNGKPDPKILEVARYFDAMNFATRSKAGAFVSVGFIDTTCPPTSVYAAYNALPGPKEIFNDPPSIHAISPASLRASRDAIFRHVEAMKQAK